MRPRDRGLAGGGATDSPSDPGGGRSYPATADPVPATPAAPSGTAGQQDRGAACSDEPAEALPASEAPEGVGAGWEWGTRPAASGAGALGRAAAVVALATLASKVLGLLRETTLADRFASTHLTDAYNVAARLRAPIP